MSEASPFVWESRIRFVDTDASRRIHYTSIFRHFEAAEDEFLRHIGCAYQHVEDREVAYPRVHVEADYLAPIGYDDLLATRVSVERVGASSFTLAFEAAVDGRPSARGKITVVAMDRKTRRARPLPEAFAAGLRAQMGRGGE